MVDFHMDIMVLCVKHHKMLIHVNDSLDGRKYAVLHIFWAPHYKNYPIIGSDFKKSLLQVFFITVVFVLSYAGTC